MKNTTRPTLLLLGMTIFSTLLLHAQSKEQFLPDEFVVPEKLETDKFRLRALTPDDAVKDYEAYITSVAHIKASQHHQPKGHRWPSQQDTIAENVKGLTEHYAKHQARVDFAFTVMNLDESVCLGCVYILPSEKEGYDAVVKMWVRTSEFYKGFDPILFSTVKEWIEKEWPFENPAYVGREISWWTWKNLPDKK